jgi:hypothetical protein
MKCRSVLIVPEYGELSVTKKLREGEGGKESQIGKSNIKIETETAISYLDVSEQDHTRHLVANNLKHLIKNQPRNSKNTIKEWNTIKNIKQKLADNNSVVAQTDKGKAIVIYKQDYDKYIAFISNNNFELINKDISKTH